MTSAAQASGIRVGLFGIGLDTYWDQFDGLKPRLEGYLRAAQTRLAASGADVQSHGLVDTVDRARAAGDALAANDIDLLFLFITTYALSSTVLPVVEQAGVPVIVLNLQPVPAIDYESFNALGDRGVMTGEWLAHCQACCVPEIVSVLKRAQLDYHVITGHLEDDAAWTEVAEWVRAAGVRRVMRRNTLGVMGHYYMGMLDVYTDLTLQSTTFGTNIDLIEPGELLALRGRITEGEVRAKQEEFRRSFDVSPDCSAHELERAARTSVALDRLAAGHQLGSLAYYFEGEPGSELEELVTSVIPGNTLLTDRHIPVAGECEVKNAQAMKILDALAAGGSFSELYAMDFLADVVMLGHDGPAHPAIADGRVGLVPLPVYHGKPGAGLSIQMSVAHGPVTLLSVGQDNDGVFLLVAEGECVEGPVLHIGNTNSRYRFALGTRDFVDRWSSAGPSHHCAIGTGHVAGVIAKLGALLRVPVIKVC
jgi:L-arabinose isomerase